jgi:hypothetical protein
VATRRERKNLVQRKNKRTCLTPTGLLMEGDSAQISTSSIRSTSLHLGWWEQTGTFIGFRGRAMQVPSAAEAATRGIALAACVELVPFPSCLDVGDARLVFVQRWFLSSLRDWVLSAAVTQRLRAGLHYAAALRLRSGGAGRGWRRVLWGMRHSGQKGA